MTFIIGIRREDKNKWERRVPLIPEHVKKLKEKNNIITIIQPSNLRIFKEDEYAKVGAIVQEDLSNCPTIFAIKEIPIDFFEYEKTYVFFSHTIKGQKYNMPMLKKMMDHKCNLIDYEKIVDGSGKRLIFFGRFAGIAGMIDTLWAFGQRLDAQNIDTPINEIKQTIHYKNLDDIKKHLKKIGNEIQKKGFCEQLTPLIIGFAGYGNVSMGAQEILNLIPTKSVYPEDMKKIYDSPSNKRLYKVIFKEEDMVQPISPKNKFNLQDYYQHPEKYKSKFEKYILDLTILMNCIYWDVKYPRLITKNFLEKNYSNHFKLQIIGDISIDINGAIEFTEKATTPDNPVFVYNPISDTIKDGYDAKGIVVMGIDNLPCELPKESSQAFSNSLNDYVSAIAKADFSQEFEKCILPSAIKKAVILYHGDLTPNFQYMNKYL